VHIFSGFPEFQKKINFRGDVGRLEFVTELSEKIHKNHPATPKENL
jgi:hypothetical protein